MLSPSIGTGNSSVFECCIQIHSKSYCFLTGSVTFQKHLRQFGSVTKSPGPNETVLPESGLSLIVTHPSIIRHFSVCVYSHSNSLTPQVQIGQVWHWVISSSFGFRTEISSTVGIVNFLHCFLLSVTTQYLNISTSGSFCPNISRKN